MTQEIDIAERQALATDRDFPDDFRKPTTWNVCGDCLRVFQGIPTRIKCRVCARQRTI